MNREQKIAIAVVAGFGMGAGLLAFLGMMWVYGWQPHTGPERAMVAFVTCVASLVTLPIAGMLSDDIRRHRS